MLDERVESLCPYLDNELMAHALSLDPVAKGDARLQGVALRRHFPAFADIPSSHSPLSEVPQSYLVPLEPRNPARRGRVTLREAGELLAPWGHPPLPRMEAKDMAFTALSALGLGGLGGSWRLSRLRDRLHTRRALQLLATGDIRRPLQARAHALRALTQWGADTAGLDGG